VIENEHAKKKTYLEEERKVTFFDRSFDSIAMGKKFPFLH
jgi:hypothetical protein